LELKKSQGIWPTPVVILKDIGQIQESIKKLVSADFIVAVIAVTDKHFLEYVLKRTIANAVCTQNFQMYNCSLIQM
jgi:hypothetical protein